VIEPREDVLAWNASDASDVPKPGDI
jgi:hypothetical protein